MTTGNIPLSYTINVSLSGTPSGLGEFATNSIVLLSNEQPLSTNNYIWAVNAQEVINEYGSNSLTAKMATALFSPGFNLRTGGGQLLVYPYTATNATSAKVVTVAITDTKLTAFKLVSSGNLKITIDGTVNNVTGLNFTSIETVADIVQVLNNKGLDCNISVTDTNKIQFQSRRFGATGSGIALSATSGSTGTDIYGTTYLDGANATSTAGTDCTGTTVAEAVAEVDEIAYVGGILTTQYCDPDTLEDNATSIQALDKIYFEGLQSLKDIAVTGAAIKSASLTKTRLLAYSYDGAEGMKRAIATYASIACSSNYSGSNTALTMNLKELTGIEADLNLNSTVYNSAKTNGVDIYGNTQGLSCCYSFSNGDYTDEVTGKLWLKKALEVALFNVLRKTNTKLPQTETAIATLKDAANKVFEQGVRNGMIAPGTWTSSIPFGNSEDFLRNIEEKGYYTYSIPISQQSQADREARKSPVIQCATKLSGAVHSVDVIVNVEK